jgi:hypothetical protein
MEAVPAVTEELIAAAERDAREADLRPFDALSASRLARRARKAAHAGPVRAKMLALAEMTALPRKAARRPGPVRLAEMAALRSGVRPGPAASGAGDGNVLDVLALPRLDVLGNNI